MHGAISLCRGAPCGVISLLIPGGLFFANPPCPGVALAKTDPLADSSAKRARLCDIAPDSGLLPGRRLAGNLLASHRTSDSVEDISPRPHRRLDLPATLPHDPSAL